MSNLTAFIIALLIALALLADHVLYDWTYTLFLARKFVALTEYIAFWR